MSRLIDTILATIDRLVGDEVHQPDGKIVDPLIDLGDEERVPLDLERDTAVIDQLWDRAVDVETYKREIEEL